MSITLFKLLIPLRKERFQNQKSNCCGCKKISAPPPPLKVQKFNKRPPQFEALRYCQKRFKVKESKV